MRTLSFVAGFATAVGSCPFALAAPLPVPWVERPLTLPEMTLSPEFTLPITHLELEGVALNAFGLNLGAGFGITDDFMVDLTPLTMLIARADVDLGGGTVSDTEVYYGTFRAGATYRFVATEAADIGGRFEFGATGATESMHLTAGLPVLLRLEKVVRIDTGVFWSLRLPTNGASVDAMLGTVGGGINPNLFVGAAAGIPVSLTVQIAEPFFAGLDTGFGIGSFRGDVDNSTFMPLGIHVGGTIAQDRSPLVDLSAGFSFPLFLLGVDASPPTTEIWQVGLAARAYIPI